MCSDPEFFHIVSGQKQGGAPCVPEDQLKQSRPCNQRPCRQFLWQVGPWSECVALGNVTAETCVGSTSGKRKREAYCQLNYGKIKNYTKITPLILTM